jgi:peptide/nickel transport system substrate-binding protein
MLLRLLSLLVVMAFVAVACGGDDDDDGAAPSPEGAAEKDEGAPQPGGRLVYGREAETASPWTPQNAICDISCHMVMRTVFDTLTSVNDDREVVGNLAETIEHNADYTEWTFTIRQGVTFHDGTPLDAAAVTDNIERHRRSFLTGKAIADVSGTRVEGNKAIVTTKRPWVTFPLFLAGQVGYIASPTWLKAVDADAKKATQPVGTGPFVFKEFVPGDKFVATKNPNYWRKGLPYLDEIEFRVLENIQSRSNALIAGDIDIMHTSNGDEIAKFRQRKDEFNLTEIRERNETSYVMLNVGDPASPLSDVRVRKALAYATDNDAYVRARNADVAEPADGPFPPGVPGYLKDSGYPKFDLDEAKKLIAEYEADKGPVRIKFHTTPDEFNLVSNQLLASMWEKAGVEVEIRQQEQGQYIIDALKGDFQAFGWRNHSGFEPDTQRFWWDSEAALPPGQFSLNFGRIKDPEIDAALDVIRENPDAGARKQAAEKINRRFGSQVYNLWNWWTVWGIASNPKVHQVFGPYELPNGDKILEEGLGIGGTHQLAQIWIEH